MKWLHNNWPKILGWWSALSTLRKCCYAGTVFFAAILSAASGAPGRILVGFWEVANFVFLARVVIWAVPNFRTVFSARGPAVRWSLTLAPLMALVLNAGVEQFLIRYTDFTLPGMLFLILLLFLFLPLAFLFSVALGILGAAIGGFGGRRSAHPETAAKAGLAGIWLTLLAIGLCLWSGQWLGFSGSRSDVLFLGLPILASWLGPATRRFEAAHVGDRIIRGLQEYFLLPIQIRGRRRTLDLRKPVCALAGFLLVSALSGLGFLSGMQASSQVWLIAQRQLLGRQVQNLQTEPAAKPQKPLVILEWDNASVGRACAESSESAVQAQLIGRLTEWKVLRLVVPPPSLELSPGMDRLAQQPLPPGTDVLARNARDLPQLRSALSNSATTILAMPRRADSPASGDFLAGLFEGMRPDSTSSDDGGTNQSSTQSLLAGLRASARRLATDSLIAFRSASLPAISLRQQPGNPHPLPVLLASAQDGAGEPRVELLDPRTARINGRTFALIDESALLVDFTRLTRGQGILRVPIDAVLDDKRIYAPTETGNSAWIPARDLLHDKLVFLEPLVSQLRTTPVGEISRMELIALATGTLLNEPGLVRPPDWIILLWSFFCAWLVTVVCGWTGWSGSWRLPIILFLILGVTVGGIIVLIWIDPVLPLTSALWTFLLLAQVGLMLERYAKNQNRAVLQRFVAPEIVQDLLEDPHTRLALGGKRERLAVLFADVRGFSRFAEEHSPEEVIKVVNAYLQVMTDALFRFGGLLDKYTGDGLMALFRIGDAGDQGVVNALRAALAMRDASLKLSADRTEGGDKSLQVGIALHVGEAVVGLVGNTSRQVNFTALGHTVVVAARLQSLAMGGEAIISQEVRLAVGEEFDLESREPVQVKGVSAPVRCYLVRFAKPPVAPQSEL
ncbi:MAG: adenylate/guanylate cyclase domain-containing protein [Verrucomicrobiota bacterium]